MTKTSQDPPDQPAQNKRESTLFSMLAAFVGPWLAPLPTNPTKATYSVRFCFCFNSDVLNSNISEDYFYFKKCNLSSFHHKQKVEQGCAIQYFSSLNLTFVMFIIKN
jgi:hypothetical protein